MRKQYEKPSIMHSIIILEEESFLKSSVKSKSLGIDQAEEGADINATLSSTPGEADAWGDVKAQHSWGDDPF